MKDETIINTRINEFETSLVHLVLKNDAYLSNDIFGIIYDLIEKEINILKTDNKEIKLDFEIPSMLNSKEFIDDLKVILNTIKEILTSDSINTDAMASILIEKINLANQFIERVKSGEMFDANHIQNKLNIDYLHDSYKKVINTNILNVTDDERNTLSNAITSKNYDTIIEFLESIKERFLEKGFELNHMAIVDYTMMEHENFLKSRDEDSEVILDGIYLRVIKEDLVCKSKWVKDQIAMIDFLDSAYLFIQ